MLLALTDYCSMGCPHCLSDCNTGGSHITEEQFISNLDFAYKLISGLPGQVLIVSGGEPFEHPKIKSLLEILGTYSKKFYAPIVIATNGHNLANDKALYDWYREFAKRYPRIFTQVTYVKEYYPRELTQNNKYYLGKIKNCTVIDDIREVPLYPQGRALSLPSPAWNTKGPKCVNLRLLANQVNTLSFKSIVGVMPRINQGKFCTPRINIDGTISLGESRLCPPIGTIEDSDAELFAKTRDCRCSKCSIALDILKESNALAHSLIMSAAQPGLQEA